MNLPNLLSLVRILLIPLFVLIFYLPFHGMHLLCAIVFGLAGITDWLDGYLARKWNQTTRFGAFIDPVADKLMVVVALVLLVERYHNVWFTLPAAVIIGREIVVSALREWMAELGKRASVAVSYIGKIKTTAQILSLLVLLGSAASWHFLIAVGVVSLYIAAVLTLWSMMAYLKAAWPDLQKGMDNSE
ncbi:MAG TPA: CDP-diacylglycerol--glycerol-3-phosphate 3-phosphatidyltransferase [Pseudomonadales bacterium]|nr:CDP-diacylglycerol--glycerol-3-phosphate 3-phosphatidyltransferase [Pseudomonadales bacterium]